MSETTSSARISIPAPGRYAKQLCNHASHMGARSDWTPPHGIVEFPFGGTCHIDANDDELTLTLDAANAGQLVRMQAILTADLERFGKRQTLSIGWS